jgi:hypothetical protein
MAHRHNGNNSNNSDTIARITADFVCFVCGAVFTTDQDRKAHLEKEAHGKLHDDIAEEERRKALEQEKLNEERIHRI